jgi:two-component system, NtrC family, response regulator AtoC
MIKIVLVEDDNAQRNIMANILRAENYQVFEADKVETALALTKDNDPSVVVTDLKMSGRGGLDLVEEIARLSARPEVVVITAFGSIETAVRAMRLGAYDYLTKPLERDELLLAIERAAEKFRLRMDGMSFRNQLANQSSHGLIAESPAMKNVLDIARKVASSDATILIRGESGTGKEKIAQLIHYLSPRGSRPMQSINCAAFPETLLESELFGYERGAFTGAHARKIGIIEAAGQSTLFLDEVADMSLNTQAKLLRTLQEREIRRVGGTTMISVDIRVIAATNKNLEDAIRKGTFRDDLFYRLNVIPVNIPPLRERIDDIPALINFFMSRRAKAKKISPRATELMCGYAWPGNVRELEAVMERTIILSAGDEIEVADLPPELRQPGASASSLTPEKTSTDIPDAGIVFEEWERELLQKALVKAGGNVAEAARLLGMTYRTFYYRAQKFGLLEGKEPAEEGQG